MGYSPKLRWVLPLLILLLGCSDDRSQRNPFLAEVNFRFEIDMNLPLYSPLTNPGSPVYVSSQGVGIRGAIVMNTGFDFMAWEATCPNHSPSPCSTMQINGQNAVCSCENFEYSLFTGQQLDRPDDGNRYFDMLFYRTQASGNILVISN